MRVLHISQPVSAGVAGVVLSLVRGQVAGGHDVEVACPVPSPLADAASSAGARVLPWAATREPGPRLAAEWWSLRRIVASSAPDVLVLHSAKAGLVGRLTHLAPPVLHVPHAWSFEAVTGLAEVAARSWEVVAGARTDRVVCVSRDERARGIAAGVGTRTAVIGNGVDTRHFRPGDASRARDELGLAPDAPTVVCVGRLTRQKGQDLLIDAWSQVLASVPAARLVVVGDGPARDSLHARAEALATDSITFVGARQDTVAIYAAADVVALPSRWEGMSLVAAEAMACARPVVAFDVDGCTELLGEAGRTVPPGDVDGLARELVALLCDPERATAIGRAGRVRAEVVADVGTTITRWEALLTETVRGARSTDAPWSAGDELRTLPATSLLVQLAGRAFVDVDLVDVGGRRRLDRARAVVLSSLGIPVRWLAPGSPPPAPGAPVLPATATAARIAEAVNRAGTPLAPAEPDDAHGPSAPGDPSDGSRSRAPQGPPVSVVITTLDEGGATAVVVRALLAQLRPDDELVLVDGGSSDGSIEALAPDPRLRVVVEPGAGISAGRNIGVGLAAHEVIVCTDAGCAPAPDFVDAFRRAFAGEDPPVLASGVYRASTRTVLDRAQALACYPQPAEVRRPSIVVRGYTRVFGTGYDPRFAIGRCVAFTRSAWRDVGGFPEHLPTGEDVSFGLAVAGTGRVVTCLDAAVDWGQRDGLAATWKMYRSYGRASTDGGDVRLLVRDGVRASAYVVAPLLLGTRVGRGVVLAGAAAYLSLPVARAVRAGASPAVVAALPLALAVKDLGKVVGAVQGAVRARRRRARRGPTS